MSFPLKEHFQDCKTFLHQKARPVNHPGWMLAFASVCLSDMHHDANFSKGSSLERAWKSQVSIAFSSFLPEKLKGEEWFTVSAASFVLFSIPNSKAVATLPLTLKPWQTKEPNIHQWPWPAFQHQSENSEKNVPSQILSLSFFNISLNVKKFKWVSKSF